MLNIDNFIGFQKKSIIAHKKGGGGICALFTRQFAPSLLWGYDLWPLRITFGTTVFAESTAERIVRSDVCPFCKSIIGNFLINSPVYEQVDCVLGVITCDQMRRMLERLSVDCNLPLFPIQFPATQTESSRRYFVESAKLMLGNISDFRGKKFEPELVRMEDNARIKAAAILEELMLSGNVSPLQLHKLASCFCWSRPTDFLAFLQSNVASLSPFCASKRVIVLGSIIGLEDLAVIRMLEENDVAPILLTSTGLNMLQGVTLHHTLNNDMLIETLLYDVFAMNESVRSRPNGALYDQICSMIQKTGADGIILKSLSFCDLWFTEKVRMRESIELPLLVLDTGYGDGADQRLETRVETFLGLL